MDVLERQAGRPSIEDQLLITYQPQAVFRVKPSTRCSSTLSGHLKEILSVAFSPDGKLLATGSGDCSVRFWDTATETPVWVGQAHSKWVLSICWAPNGKLLASSGMDGGIFVWDAATGKQLAKAGLQGHSAFVACLAWEPLHRNAACSKLASASKDGTVKIWDVPSRTCILTLSTHTDAITCLRWGGEGFIYSGSRDRTINIWNAADGTLWKRLEGHAHWINTMALSTDFYLRTGATGHRQESSCSQAAGELTQEAALARYTAGKGQETERLVSGSDDFSIFLWHPHAPAAAKKPIRMTGHQALVNQVVFSPDGRFIASASFDKSVKLWNGTSGLFICTFRAHVSPVYQVAWSPDSRYLVSASKDSTCKLWSIRTKALHSELPGHRDEVYAVDWSPQGDKIASGGKDRDVKIWCN